MALFYWELKSPSLCFRYVFLWNKFSVLDLTVSEILKCCRKIRLTH